MQRLKKVLGLTVLALMCSVVTANAVDLRFSGFGDFVYGTTRGKIADAASRTLFEQYGTDEFPLNTTQGFGLTGTDFVVIADMNEQFTFLGEVNLQTGRGGSADLELDVERFFSNYRFRPELNVQTGLFFTPVGYNNRFLYARAWLMNSIQVPDFFEEELNLFPTHSIGVMVHGAFQQPNGHSINYAVSVANGRPRVPVAAVYARDFSDNKEVTGLIEWIVPGYKDSRIGVSGWTGGIQSVKVDALGDVVSFAGAEPIELREIGFDPYIVLNTSHVGLNAEYVVARQEDTRGNLGGGTYEVSGLMAELSLHLNRGKVHPYVRYDKTKVPDGGGPYLSLREDGGEFTRSYVPEFEAVMGGVALDVSTNNRLKFEVIRHFAGPRRELGFTVQSAFGF